MSIASWEKEFCPEDIKKADSFEKGLTHSLAKFTGLKPANLRKHNVEIADHGVIRDKKGKFFVFTESNCWFCLQDDAQDCHDCKLRAEIGQVCFKSKMWEDTFRGKPTKLINVFKKMLRKKRGRKIDA